MATDLIYIPKGKGDIQFVSAADEDAFFEFMDQDSYLKNTKGKYAKANSTMSPWVHQFDLRIAREYYIPVGESTHALQLNMDILNIGNLIKSKWGVQKRMHTANNGQILRYEGKDANNVPTFSFPKYQGEYLSKTFDYYYSPGQTWMLQVGAKYTF